MKVPAYYIFTDKELDKIIELKPDNLNSLKKLKILSDIKIQYHGQEIVDILNKFFSKEE